MSKSIHNEKYRKLIDELKKARLEAGLTQQQVADCIGRPQSFVAKVEGYERRLDIIEFFEFAEITNIDLIETLKVFIKNR